MTDKMFTRGISIPPHRPKTFNDEKNSVRVVAVTENPVRVWDWERKSFIDEILLIEGAYLPPSGQIPLLDSHNRSSVSSILGSARNFSPNGNILECDVFFSSTESGANAAQNVKEGHLTDFSVGYLTIDSDYIPVGESKNINSRTFKGPVKVTTKWSLRELSLTPIGADENATARSHDSTPIITGPIEEQMPVQEQAVEQPLAQVNSEARQEQTQEQPVQAVPSALPEHQTELNPPIVQDTPAPVQPERQAATQTELGDQPGLSLESEPILPENTRQEDIPPAPKSESNIIDMIFFAFIGIMLLFLLRGLF